MAKISLYTAVVWMSHSLRVRCESAARSSPACAVARERVRERWRKVSSEVRPGVQPDVRVQINGVAVRTSKGMFEHAQTS